MSSKPIDPGAVATQLDSPHLQAKILSEALPYMQRYNKQTVVIKYGGHAMGDEALAESFAKDIVLLKQSRVNPVVVHGGGPQIAALLDRLGIESAFAGGLRVTSKATMDVVEMVLAGLINKRIVAAINRQGGKAVGISGKDGDLMIARKHRGRATDTVSLNGEVIDLGYVGEPELVDPHIVDVMTQSDLIPVVAPVGVDRAGDTLNSNADTFAGALASAMQAKRLLLLTDVEGVLDRDGALIERLTTAEARDLIEDGTIAGGMIPKVESCLSVVQSGVEAVTIVNGRVPHAVLLELLTKHGAGTIINRPRTR